MLRDATRIGRADNGTFELAVMLALAGSSFAGLAPAYVLVPIGTSLLLLSTLHEHAHLHPRFVRARAGRLLAGGILAAAAMSLAFATLCYTIGRFFAWLIAG